MSFKDERVDSSRQPAFRSFFRHSCSLSHSKTPQWHPAFAVAIVQKYRSDELRPMWKLLPSRDTGKAKWITGKLRSYRDRTSLVLPSSCI